MLGTIVTQHVPVQQLTSPPPCPVKWSAYSSVPPNTVWIYCAAREQSASAIVLIHSQLKISQTLIYYKFAHSGVEARKATVLLFSPYTVVCFVWAQSKTKSTNSSWLMFTQGIYWCRQRRDRMIRYAYSSAVCHKCDLNQNLLWCKVDAIIGILPCFDT